MSDAAAYGQIGGGIISAYGSYLQGEATANSLNAQADLLVNNAQEAKDAGIYNAYRQSLVAGQRIGAIKASYGASGLANTSGSVISVIQASTQNAEMDRLNILHNADLKATNYMNQSTLDRYGADQARKGAGWAAAGQIAGSALTAAALMA